MMPFGDPFGGAMFSIIPTIIFIMFIVMFVIFIVNLVKGAKQWSYNNSQPVLTVDARVVAKRTNVSHSTHHTGDNDNMIHHHSTSTTYYVTFEVEGGDRIEFNVKDSEYGLLAEGDTGKLTLQGTRYLGFKRTISE